MNRVWAYIFFHKVKEMYRITHENPDSPSNPVDELFLDYILETELGSDELVREQNRALFPTKNERIAQQLRKKGELVVVSPRPNEKSQVSKLAQTFKDGKDFIGATSLPIEIPFEAAFSTVFARISLAKKVQTRLAVLDHDACMTNLEELSKLIGRIGSDSAFGEAYKLCVPILAHNNSKGDPTNERCNYYFAVKSIFQDQDDFGPRDSALEEIRIMKKMNRLVEQRVTPHLPLMYDSFWCGDCQVSSPALKEKLEKNRIRIEDLVSSFVSSSEKNKRIYENTRALFLRRFQGLSPTELTDMALKESLRVTSTQIHKIVILPCYLVANELANSDFLYWLSQRRSLSQIKDALLQVAIGLYAAMKHLGFRHEDLHCANVLVNWIPLGGYFRNKIDGKVIDVEPNGFLFKLWDFGKSVLGSTNRDTQDFQDLLDSMLVHYKFLDEATIRWVKTMKVFAKGKSYMDIITLLHHAPVGAERSRPLDVFEV